MIFSRTPSVFQKPNETPSKNRRCATATDVSGSFHYLSVTKETYQIAKMQFFCSIIVLLVVISITIDKRTKKRDLQQERLKKSEMLQVEKTNSYCQFHADSYKNYQQPPVYQNLLLAKDDSFHLYPL